MEINKELLGNLLAHSKCHRYGVPFSSSNMRQVVLLKLKFIEFSADVKPSGDVRKPIRGLGTPNGINQIS